MAFGAIRGDNPVDGELIFVVISMAGGTLGMGKRICKTFGMTFFAIYRLMFAGQFEPGLVVVEVFGDACYTEGLFVVAVGALVAELVVVHILVAGRTVFGFHAFPILKYPNRLDGQIVARITTDLFVFSF